MKNSMTKMIALLSALTLITGAAASCGKNEPKTKEVKKASEIMTNSYRAEKIECDIPINQETGYIDGMARLGDSGKVLIYGTDYENNAPLLYLTDEDFLSVEKVDFTPDIPENTQTYFNTAIAPDGTIVILSTINDYGDFEMPNYDDPDFDYESFDFDAMESARKTTYKIYTISEAGEVLSEAELEKFDDISSEEMYMSGNYMAISSDRIFLPMNDKNYIFDTNGKKIAEIDTDDMNYVNQGCVSADGRLALAGYGKSGECINFFDLETFKPSGDELSFEGTPLSNIYSIFTGNEDYPLYVSTSSGFFTIDKDGKPEELINWQDSDLGQSGPSAVIALENSDFIAYIYDYQTGESGLYRLTRRDASELENTKVITIGMLYDDWAVSSQITKFNKESSDLRIKTVNYDQYNVYDEETQEMTSSSTEQLKKDIIAGNAPDMIVTYDFSVISSLASKGVYADLGDFISKDSDLSEDDIMPNVLEASKINGKLYGLSPSFTVQTMAVKTKFFDKENWTLDDLIETYNNAPEGMELFYDDTKQNVFNSFIYMAGNYIDYENGTCHFDSPDFLKFLEFANQFPDDSEGFDWENSTDDEMQTYWNEQETAHMNDKALIRQLYMSEFREFARYKQGIFNDDITLVGAPSSDGKGASISLGTSFAILNDSPCKDECWNFIKGFFSDEYYEGQQYYYGLPTVTSAFEKKAEESMERPFWVNDETGEKEYYDDSYWVSDHEVKIDPLTKEEKDYLVNYIKGATKRAGDYDEDVYKIIDDEIEAYFKGEKTAQEAADVIQNRVSILVSEKS